MIRIKEQDLEPILAVDITPEQWLEEWRLDNNGMTSEAGHWYDRKTGEPRYTIIGKNGAERDTTLRDARKLDYVPSVTMIMRNAAAPGLLKYFLDQLGMAILTLPRIDGESDDDFLKRAETDAAEHAGIAREKGKEIHG